MDNWYKHWFESEEYLSVYQHRDEEDAQKLLSTLFSIIQIPINGKILDAACGAGRHSILLSKCGYKVTGFDLSKPLLNIAQKNVEQLGLKVNFINADLRNICLKEKFDLVTNIFTSFGYFESDEENFAFIKNSWNMLNSDGFFVLDYLNKSFVIQNLVANSSKKIGNKNIYERRFITNDRIEKEIIIEEFNSRKRYIESVKLYEKDEIVSKFGEIGYHPIIMMGDYSGEEFNSILSQRLILVFKK